MDDDSPDSMQGGRLIARAIAGVFGLIGLTVVIFLWSAPFDEFGSPPLFFRVFGSFIGVVFMLTGFGGAASSMGPQRFRRRSRRRRSDSDEGDEPQQRSVGYTCHNCGSGLGTDADVSPSGDVKCGYCDRWFNIHRAG